ncbi:DUF7528 family protein [Halomarina litorea]|uniref:DUF7528 family protein n=1 Tax=Halomarina litorea TaxID=2961595 RepID=UPI0020C5059F|nr:hypothetical protein [Halomarina sp. BCD28]
MVTIDGTRHALTPEAARALVADIHEALSDRSEFVHTACETRRDGRFVVSRRRGTSAGTEVVFDSPGEVRVLYGALPERFGASDVTRVSGSRRHLLVRFFVEHPDYNCELVSENPLAVQKK